ncbi:hypothetical protein MIND_00085300 [Mycena indigotica]|uniref:MYND-type domain-containing protein n=1 Tax=Mycena indigotica TaxID=2126181 RepID=A0A8H6TFA5_9AGAR|nr:uncharacterized protein MIND_00085300 [Mycena indigotica]KAF7315697.1 hypothetical protein MIND_00085300 [Mycena indigotica]
MSSAGVNCTVCDKPGVSRCSDCRTTYYCGPECQRADWKTHKVACAQMPKWYDKHRKNRDGSLHEGRMELITWDCPAEGLGWGACFKEESDDLKKDFQTKYGGDCEKFHEFWPQGFRWTCCGMSADMDYGCDHHGTGKKPCTCDFCRMGKPLPDSIYKEKTASRHGLQLQRGPDPRSSNFALGMIAETARTVMGLAIDD